MSGAEEIVLLLTCKLGEPGRKVLTTQQLHGLLDCLNSARKPMPIGSMTVSDLMEIGCSMLIADQIVELLKHGETLEKYLKDAESCGCYPITRAGKRYPKCLTERLGTDAPDVLWVKGDVTLLERPMVSLVGSRDLHWENFRFAAAVGKQAAQNGYVLVSGNARGADQTAQEACLDAGGSVISIVADALGSHPRKDRVLYLSEDGYEYHFSSHRALHRNHLIHCLGQKVFVAQTDLRKGGTWSGTAHNLKHSLRPVFCFRDGSEAAAELERMGAKQITVEDLGSI